MKIDYSLPQSSASLFYLDANVRWGIRHVQAGFSEAPIGFLERAYHVFFGVLLITPLLGHGLAAIDYSLNGRITALKLKETDPYRRGFEFGSRLKEQTQFLYQCAKQKIDERIAESPVDFQRSLDQLKAHIPPHMHEEMRGLSAGAGVSLEDVYKIHTFIDVYAGQYGCSAVASVKEGGNVRRVAKTNHFGAQPGCSRLLAVNGAPLHDGIKAHQRALADASMDDTVQAAVFDVHKKEVHMASAWEHAAWKIASVFSFFKRKREPATSKEIFAAFNLDWPWPVLSPYFVPVSFKSQDGRKSFVNLTVPGYLGVLRGMNEEGVVVGCCQSGNNKQEGMPVTLLFRDLLENSATAAEAERRLLTLRPASSMNLIVAGKDGAFAAELDPVRAQTGIADIARI